jgi:hypothetical protein
VGKRGEGWAVSLSSLKHERQSVGTTLINPRMLDGVIGLARAIMVRGRPAIHDPVIRNRLVELQARMYANVYHGYRLTTLGLRQQETGVAGMITKLYGSTLGYELPKLAMDIVADGGLLWADSAPASGIAPNAYMQAFGALAGGGTANIQRNIIAERGLGLPRERLFATGRKLMTALKDLLADAGIPAQILGEPPTFEVWFTDREITDFHSNMQADAALRERFVQLLVDRGIIKAHEKFFISLAHTDEEVETTIAAFRSAIAELREGRV